MSTLLEQNNSPARWKTAARNVAHRDCLHQMLVSPNVGGAAMVGISIATYLRAQGRRTLAWVPAAGAASEALSRQSIPFRFFGLDRMQGGKVSHAAESARVAWHLRGGNSLIHVHTPTLFGILRPALALARLPTIAHVHSEPAPADIPWAFKTLPDVIVTCAAFMVESIRAMLGPRGERATIVSIPNSVDVERFVPGDRAARKRALGASENRPLLLMLANLAPHKGQETAIRAVARLKAEAIDVDCWLVGEERSGAREFTSRLEALIRDSGTGDRVRLLGFRRDSAELLQAADVLLLPSTDEGLPLSVLEAQAAGVPVLAAPTAGIPEAVLDGETGFLIAADDAAGYAHRIAWLLADRDGAAAIADRARRRVIAQFSLGSYCAKTIELYDEVLARHRAG